MKNNPYVGPRPYEWEDRHNFYGRNREARELRALIVSERVVLFYAQSGAGKTSLLNAQVIPALEEEEGFHVLPVARVGSELPPGIDPGTVGNVFVFSVLMALAGEDVDPRTLLGHTLRSFLEPLCPEPEDEFESRPPVLILDQFEELFTTHRERWQDAKGFFLQVREALDALSSLGVVFAMREDHVAELDPYAPLFPRRLRARFRMERLGPTGALAAVSKPALNAGCRYDPGVAERLVDDLRRIKVIKVQRHVVPKGDGEAVLGPFVEPVQLQVVCQRLWENLPEQEDQAIQWEEVEKYGNIDRALTDFYERALDAAVQETGVGERQARRWFSQQLITPAGTRGLALRGEEETAGLPNAAVDVMEKHHLIRADVRAGARWYELTHDRLVEPIQEANRAWELEQLKQLPPEISTFELDRAAIMEGQEINLAWRVEGADEVFIEPINKKETLSGSISLLPTETTEYILKVIKSGISVATSQPQKVIVKKLHPTFWAHLRYHIQGGRATPIISNALSYNYIFDSIESLAQAWASTANYSWGTEVDLTQVAQFINVTSTDEYTTQYSYLDFLKRHLLRVFEDEAGQVPEGIEEDECDELSFSEIARRLGYFHKHDRIKTEFEDPFYVLANLPLPVYLTTNYHELMEDALRRVGKEPYSEICHWHDGLDDIPSLFQTEPDLVLTIERPLVYHFYGLDAYPESLVLTEDDHMSFMAKVREDRDVVPIEVRQAIYRSWPLLLGYDWQSWEFRTLLQGLLSLNLFRRPVGTFQSVSYRKKSETIVYMQDYLAKYQFDIYWDDSQNFLQELWREWRRER